MSVRPNETVTVTGSGFSPNVQVTLSLDTPTTKLATVDTDAKGDLSTPVTMPATLTPGSHQIIASTTNLSCQLEAAYIKTGPSTAAVPD